MDLRGAHRIVQEWFVGKFGYAHRAARAGLAAHPRGARYADLRADRFGEDLIGGTLGLLAGVGLLAIPGLGPFIAAGPIMAGLAGLGVGGTVGGVTGALIGMGIPEFEAKRYEGGLQKGGILLSVHCDTADEIKRAKEVLKQTNAEDVSSTGEASTDAKTSDNEAARRAARGSF